MSIKARALLALRQLRAEEMVLHALRPSAQDMRYIYHLCVRVDKIPVKNEP